VSAPGPYLLALDQGTTSTRAILFDAALAPVAVEQIEFAQHYPRPGWVEHEPDDLFRTSVEAIRGALRKAGATASDCAALGITNQRETVLVWDRASGAPVGRAIVWQDRRTAEACASLRADGVEPEISGRTGLLLDPYFSATKIAWLLDAVPGTRQRAERGELAFGTVDTYLLWRLTGGRVHATDATNASRTLLYDIDAGAFDEELCALFRVPMALLPEIRDSSGDFGATLPELFGGAIAIRGLAGDQQAAMAGQGCFSPGMVKATYGTGAFMLLNTGEKPVFSRSRLLTTVACQLGGARTFALEGAIFVAGAAVQWLRDRLGVIGAAAETATLAAASDPGEPVILVPGFVGLGAPYWDAEARGALLGLTRNTGRAEIARAALEAMGYQTRDLIEAMRGDWPDGGELVLRVDGGMVANDWMLQFLAGMAGAPVDRPKVMETTALGAAYLAGLSAGLCPPPSEMASRWQRERRFLPAMDAAMREAKYQGWKEAVARVRTAP
jgi:glycerol kinase